MRISAVLALCLTSCVGESTPAVDYALYLYEDDIRTRDRLIRAAGMMDDLGGVLIGSRHPELAAATGVVMIDLPEPESTENLWVVAGHHHDPATEALVEAGRAIWSGLDGVTILAVPDSTPDPGFRCHGAVREVRTTSLRPTDLTAQRTAVTSINPTIQSMVGQIDRPRLEQDVDTLVAFGSRRHGQPGEFQAQAFLEQRFDDLGLLVETVNYDGGADVVCGVLPGLVEPEKLVIVGGHYDSVNWQGDATSTAPGADDDASGTAAVLELARVLADQPGFDYTLRFCGWSGEEFGLLGSEAEANRLANANADVVAMIQLDMIGYSAPGGSRDVVFILNDTTAWLNTFMMEVFNVYVPTLNTTTGFLGGGSSDHRSFFLNGFPATWPFESGNDGSPFIHTSQDTVGTSLNDWDKALDMTRGSLAALATLARPIGVTLDHIALPDTTDDIGPYTVSVEATSQTAATVASVDLRWRLVDDPSWTTIPMQPVPGTDRWQTDLPAPSSPAQVEYAFDATDSAGNLASLPALEPSATPFTFTVGALQTMASFDFEAADDEGWTHVELATQDDWMRGPPGGLSGDPNQARSGSFAWGNDLGPAGYNGEYQADVSSYLESPPLDTTGASVVRLRYARWLTVEKGQYDQARVSIDGTTVWENPFDTDVIDTSWVIEDLDVSAVAADRSDVRVRFSLETDGGLELGGWNIDDLSLYSLQASSELGPLRLMGPASTRVGDRVTLRMAGLPPRARWTLILSQSNAGSTALGEPLEVGAPYSVVASARADAQGNGEFSVVIPASAAGRTFYLEAGTIAGTLQTTNLHTLTVEP